MTAADIIERLALAAHPEGGWYRETVRRPAPGGGRDSLTAIHFLLDRGQRSHWHRVDADELWLWHAGSPLVLRMADDDEVTDHRLGGDVFAGHAPQLLVPAGAWQAAEAPDGWGLVSCVVVPGFDFAAFELAAEGWSPGG
ncbi:cupin domain-containing protein [Sphingomonas bacterium]|uniref:cupin domain-containing protein n=1 Tax=Sphingomonas bacterium TaxID=1895847 RepID=UPI001575E4CC|nr:cupin domain-containing protein [Sphingomonas bacterium]